MLINCNLNRREEWNAAVVQAILKIFTMDNDIPLPFDFFFFTRKDCRIKSFTVKNLLPRYSSFCIDNGQRMRRFSGLSAGGSLKS